MNELTLNIFAGISVVLVIYALFLFYKQDKELKNKKGKTK